MRFTPLLWIIGCLALGTSAHGVRAAEITVPGDVSTIQAAIDLASDGDIILVSAGTYAESIDFAGKSIHLLALDGAAATTIDPQGLGPGVQFVSGETPMSVFEGFTVTGGVGDPTGGLIAGGGVRVIGSSPQIIGCVIANNVAADGAGVYVAGSAASPLLFQCSIEFNAATFTGGGVCIEESATPELFACALLENTALSGGGVWVHIATPTIRDSSFLGNSATLAAGALAAVSADVFVNACDFRDNSAQNGGAVVVDDAILLCRRSMFYNNSAQAFGGALRLQGTADVTLEHCTIAYNSGIQGGGAADVPSADSFLIHNSIVYGNLFGSVPFEPAIPPATTIEYSVVQGGFTGEGNLDEDPLLENLEAGDFALLIDSPCINAGDPQSTPDPDGTVADIGALYRELIETRFIRGDCNGDTGFNVGDAVFGLFVLFPVDGEVAPCLDACDTNDDGAFNVADVITGLGALFSGAPSPSAPYPSCGDDPTTGVSLGCDSGACAP